MNKCRIIQYFLRVTGIICILTACVLFRQYQKEEQVAVAETYEISKKMMHQPLSKPIMSEDFSMAVHEIDGVAYIGQLRISSQKLHLPIAAKFSYQQLESTPAIYRGSYYKDNIVVCAHNYSGHFEALNRTTIGEEIIIETVDNQIVKYIVTNKEVVEPKQVDSVIKIPEKDNWDLTLFTCTPSGLQRLMIRCERAK